MKAVVYEKFKGALQIRQVTEPVPETHGVVVKVRATGMCLSDWHGWQGHDSDIDLPHVPGHELAGEIVETGSDVKNFRSGDRVTVPFVAGCGRCEPCQSGNQQVCDHQSQPGFTHWGSFAEYVKLDYADVNLVRIPDEISDETASILGCRFVTSFRAVVEQGSLRAGEFVAVHGCGGVGLSAIMIASALGAEVVAVDINESALKLATALGASHQIRANSSKDVVGEIKELTRGGVHVSLDALGHPETCFNSIANLRKRGRHVQVGLMAGSHRHPKIPMDRVIANELEIFGSHGMQAHKYPQMLEMIRTGKAETRQTDRKNSITGRIRSYLLPRMNKFKSSGITVINSF